MKLATGDTLELFQPLCNGYVRVEARTEKIIGDAVFCSWVKPWTEPPRVPI